MLKIGEFVLVYYCVCLILCVSEILKMEEDHTFKRKAKAKIGGRAPNYIFGEKQTLLQLIVSKKHIIENKKTNLLSMDEKNRVWERVTKEFNSASPAMVTRTTDSLKKYYNNLKEDFRKRLANEKKDLHKTGGGGPPPPAERNKADHLLFSIVNEKTLYGVPDTIAPYDGDYIETNNNTEETMDEDSHSQSLLLMPRIKLLPNSKKAIPSTSVNIFKTALDPKLKQIIEDLDIENDETNTEVVLEETNECEKKQEPKEKALEKSKIKFTCLKKNIIKSRRRLTVVRTLTSSRLGELYENLIQKKLELLDGLKKKHTLRMEILQIDKKIKGAELNCILQRPKQAVHQMPHTQLNEFLGESVECTLRIFFV